MKKNKMIKMGKIIGFLFGIFLLNTNMVYAQDNNELQNKEEVVISESGEVKEKLEVEILTNSYDEEFIKNVILEDGTRIGDYDYTIIESPLPLFPKAVRSSAAIAQYFNYAAWITKSDGLTALSLDPTFAVRTAAASKTAAWNVLSNASYGFAGNSKWTNTQIMKWQFDCHYWFAPIKDYWNLEPSRTANSYLFGVVLSACNP